MANQAAKKTSWAEPGLFGDDQGDLFGTPAPVREVYVPKPEHVRNTLKKWLAELEAADEWPWLASAVKRRKAYRFEELFTALDDAAEAAIWRGKFSQQVTRLDAADSPTNHAL